MAAGSGHPTSAATVVHVTSCHVGLIISYAYERRVCRHHACLQLYSGPWHDTRAHVGLRTTRHAGPTHSLDKTCLMCRLAWRIVTLYQWRIQRGPRGHAPKLMTVWRKNCESCCRRDSVFSTLAMIKFVAYSPPGKIMFSTLFCRNSSAFDRATVSLECQTGKLYWRPEPGRSIVQKQLL